MLVRLQLCRFGQSEILKSNNYHPRRRAWVNRKERRLKIELHVEERTPSRQVRKAVRLDLWRPIAWLPTAPDIGSRCVAPVWAVAKPFDTSETNPGDVHRPPHPKGQKIQWFAQAASGSFHGQLLRQKLRVLEEVDSYGHSVHKR